MRDGDVFDLDSGHVFIDRFEQIEQGDGLPALRDRRRLAGTAVTGCWSLTGNGVDCGDRPAGEVAHCLSCIDVLGSGRLVDVRGSSLSVSDLRSTCGISALRVPRRSRRTTAPLPVKPS